ncbi:NAD-dependent protein deacylase, partial [Lactobacillus jensenii]|nr:NAD-dependent protein deacylase [Lactobacillus jensenii]
FQGRHLVVINKNNVLQDSQADLVIKGKIGEVLSKAWKVMG